MSAIGPMIAASGRLGLGYAERLLTDVSADQFARFARIGDTVIESNHPAFICGHLGLYASEVLKQLGHDPAPHVPPSEFVKVFSKNAVCVDDPDGTIYPAMNEITSRMNNGYAAVVEALEQADDAVFLEENPLEGMRQRFPTKGAAIGFLVGGHFMMHMGQLSGWRRAIGMGPA